MAQHHITEIEAKLNEGVHEGEVHGCWVPRDALAALPDFWHFLPDGAYCPATFDESVPSELSEANPLIERDGYMYVFGYNAEFAFYFKLGNSLHVRTRCFSLAEALGTFVAREMAACMRDPGSMQLDAMNDTEASRDKPVVFDLHNFEEHLGGLLSDLVYCCGIADDELMGHDYKGPVMLVVVQTVPAPNICAYPDNKHEWQRCAQGFARIEAVL